MAEAVVDDIDQPLHEVRSHCLVAQLVERAKIELTDRPSASVAVDLTDARFSAEITRAGLEETIRSDVDRVIATVERTIVDAGLKPADITAVFLTGGSTAIPLARGSILSLVPDAAVVEGDVFGSVGLGLALDARRKFG